MKLDYNQNQISNLLTFLRNPLKGFTDTQWHVLTSIFKERLFDYNLGSDDFTDIGALPTKMYETLELKKVTQLHAEGIDTKLYYESLENRYGAIWDLSPRDINWFEYTFEQSVNECFS